MGILDTLFGEFIDVISFTDDTQDTIVWRFERHGNEIKYGAKLTVREGQAAVFVHEGRIADVFKPGMYFLETNNLPILSTLQHWDHGFESPFKSEIYFVNTTRQLDLKWGTKNPIMLRDAEFGPVRLRAFGNYAVRVSDPAKFLREITGTDGEFTIDEISNQLRNIIVARFANAIASSRIPVLDLAANYDDLSVFVSRKISAELQEYGLSLTKLLIENISLPEEVERALDRRTSMGVVGDLTKYAQFQAAESMRTAAANPSGGMGAGLGMGMGMGMAQQMATSGPWGQHSADAAVPPPIPEQQYWIAEAGKSVGPMSLSALISRLGGDNPMIWKKGMAAWAPANTLKEIQEALPPAPPA